MIALRIVAALVLALAPCAVSNAAFSADATLRTYPAGEWPLRPTPTVVRRFDPPSSPWGAGHRGVDLLGSVGQQVRTALPGRVRFAGMLAGRGVLVVDHGATRTTYEPLTALVTVGDRVTAGEPIGLLQLGGSHCWPRACLHWGWIRNADDVYLDPLLLVDQGPVRLLPWLGRSSGSDPPAMLMPWDGLAGRPAAVGP